MMVENKKYEADASQMIRTKHISKKKCRQNIDEATNDEDVEEVEKDANESEHDESNIESDEPPEGRAGRHIHPCICDLTESAKRRIAEFQNTRRVFHQKFITRKAEIEEEIKQRELQRLEKERERSEQKELFGDEYELTDDGMRKRKKRSARRVSMVSLGVRQVINWKKEPKVAVKYNTCWRLRHDNTQYCTKKYFILPCPEEVDWKKEPMIPVRFTISSRIRRDMNLLYKTKLIEAEDKRPPFMVHYIP